MSEPIALVTGGLGFLGAALCRVLDERGHRIRILDDGSRGKANRLGDLLERAEIHDADVRDEASVRKAARGAATIWHLAAINGTRHFYEIPDEVFEVGIIGTLNVLRAAIAEGVRRVVLVSSSEVYGTAEIVPTPEEVPLVVPSLGNPRFSYGGSKLASELMGLYLGVHRGLHVVTVRPHNVYGPDMGDDHVIPELTTRMVKLARANVARPVQMRIEGDGSETRAFCFVADAARGLFVAGTRASSGAVVHIGSEEEVSISALGGAIADVLGLEVELLPSERRLGSPTRRCPSVEAAKALGWEPTTALRDGLVPTVSWYAEHAVR